MNAVEFNHHTMHSYGGTIHRTAVVRIGRLKVAVRLMTSDRAIYLEPTLTLYRRNVRPDERTMA